MPKLRLGRAVRRTVVVGQVEVGDAEVEGPAQRRALVVDRHVVAEVVPETQRDGGQVQPARSAPPVGDGVVAGAQGLVVVRVVSHAPILPPAMNSAKGLSVSQRRARLRIVTPRGSPRFEGSVICSAAGGQDMTRITVTVDGVEYSDEVEPRTLLVHYLRETARQDGHGRRLRHQQLRGLHRPPRRPQREVLQRARRPGRRARGHDDRGPGPGRRAAPDAAGVPRVPRPPVRLLHARDDHAGHRPAQGQPRTPPRRRSARGWRATSVDAPATTTSSWP